MLTRLEEQGLKLGLITNGLGEFQTRSIEALAISEYFDVILISEIEGIKKPQSEIFLKALKQLQVKPQEAVFIGDHPIHDIQGSRKVGMKGIWKNNFSGEKNVESDGIIRDLNEIEEIIKE